MIILMNKYFIYNNILPAEFIGTAGTGTIGTAGTVAIGTGGVLQTFGPIIILIK